MTAGDKGKPSMEKVRRRDFTAFDWIGVAMVGMKIPGFIGVAIASPFLLKMYKDFGTELPGLTKLCLSIWAPLLATLLTAAPFVAALVPAEMALTKRRMLLGISYAISVIFLILCIIALYLPVLNMVNAIVE